ncbi:NADH-quinone oxidoreductase subunit C [Oceanispirochaeta sp.]|jgi:hypothetical protein|uniref:NADH-quinone oxidoreductase subunit C n=1 Tax=Oceanispirochaeta sp. TaxID=2035350 RepID=UPI00262EBE02|nr:NADH-quinone oxidoreductase subunit C [Oceanispirochaeta sp.]MDA3957135.1 NADH-quinone oxidoreductase subunit C [Oceanispirochaeta sp.]
MNQIYENLATMTNGDSILIKEIPLLEINIFSETIIEAVNRGQRVSALFGVKTENADATALYVILADDESNQLNVGKTIIKGAEFPSITARCPQVHLFEREIAEQFGIIPMGHPWFKPVRYCHSWTARDAWNRNKDEPILPGVGDFYKIEGEQIHEVAVGPVHAGVIEPGHYRFQCHGEQVFHLEIALGFQHRGVEKAMETGPDSRSLHFMETLAGDTTIGHSISYCQIYEALSHTQKPVRAQALRGIALELERIANHVGDLGA